MVGNQFWRAEFKPRNTVPWIICTICYALSALLLLVIRVVLKKRNDEKDARLRARGIDPDEVQNRRGHDETVLVDGEDTENAHVEKVNVAFLDLTDMQNDEFRYRL